MKKFIIFILLSVLLCGQSMNTSANSLYADVKAHNIGDVVMVIIAETANAAQESKVNSTQKTSASANGGVTGNLTSFLPLFGATTDLANSQNGSAGTQQKDQLTGKITATIIDKLDNGMLRIEGERIVEVNGEKNRMHLEGLVRSRDIGTNNTVYSYNIADAKIIYKKDNFKDKIVKQGKLQRLTTTTIMLGLIGLAIAGKSL
ncbi:MAG: flagellar basal body L-ring protein FlgH [FCB group bacterium]|nr:flagellar basal body L-ring protein FlgH [FCB group bacterium]